VADPDRTRASRRGTERAAIAAAAWTAIIFAFIPLVRPIQRALLRAVDPGWITVAVLLAVGLALAAAVERLRRRPRPVRAFDVAWLVAIAALAAWCAWALRGRPEEAIHLLQFGLLAVLLYRAMRPAEPDVAILVAAVLLGSLVGTVDEIIQWIVPARFWDLRDVAVNSGACVLAAAALWRLDRGPWRRPRASSVSLALRLAAALLVLLVLCLANTPRRVAWYAEHVPGLAPLAEADNAMAEYGYRHRLPGIGELKSRLTLAELADQDRTRAAEVAAVLDRYPEGRYQRFLDEHPATANPFLYEARVHLFSRDVHLRELRSAPPGSAAAREHATIALREQHLLERVFGSTLARSGFNLKPQPRQLLEQLYDPGRPFVSASAAHLITGVGERSLRLALLAAAAILLALDAVARRRSEMEAAA
jgi:hypothetical protein